MTFKLVPRFAIEPLEVTMTGPGQLPGVVLTNENVHANLSPDQARRVAVALIEAAQRVERPGKSEWP